MCGKMRVEKSGWEDGLEYVSNRCGCKDEAGKIWVRRILVYGSELMWVRICEWEDVGGKRWVGGWLKICW